MVSEPRGLPGVMAARFQSFAKRMPAYYASFVAMMLAVVYVFYPLAPASLSCVLPLGAAALGVWRGLWWLKRRDATVTDEEARRHLLRATRTLTVVAVVITLLDIRLFFYADIHARYFLLVQLLASVMCGFYCLMHLRTAALVICAAVMVPFDILALLMRQPSMTVAACTATITVGVMILAMVGYQRDFISLVEARAETLKLSEENLHLANLDVVTGLPNRRRFFEVLELLAHDREDQARTPAVGVMDLDGFKPVNDTYGHLVGDKVLAEIAERLRGKADRLEHLCRLGGDEFAFVVYAENEAELGRLGAALIETVRQPMQMQGRVISVGCSVGFALWPETPGSNGAALFEHADYALYHAKREGRARTVLFSEEHETLIREQGRIEQTLRSADLEAEFYPMFQPIVDLGTGTAVAFECLARWKSPVLGHVSPGVFIPIAEHTGLISELTLVLLRKGLEAASQWPEEVHIAFNVSPHDIASRAKTVQLIGAIEQSGVTPHRVAIELTETALLHNFAEVSSHLALLRAIGVSISLDDFGTGHSSLSYVHALPLDKVKVDRSFVRDVETNPTSRNIVRSVITLCRDLGFGCVVEGVETEAQLEILRMMGGDLIQGYFFSKPMPQRGVATYLLQTDGAQSEWRATPLRSEAGWAANRSLHSQRVHTKSLLQTT